MRSALVACIWLLLAGCTGISSVPANEVVYGPKASPGVPYSLPKGLVPVEVFVEAAGIGLTIEPAKTVADSSVGVLVARLHPSPFNDEKMKLVANQATGFLSTVSSESTAQLLAIVEEAAKTVGRLKLQNAKAEFLAKKVVVFSDSFDPYDPADVARINDGIAAALDRASRAFQTATRKGSSRDTPTVTLDVGPFAPPAHSPWGPLKKCEDGVCARAMTAQRIRVLLDGRPFASKTVALPSREIIAVPVPQTILADQKLNIGITDGILTSYDFERDSELLGLVKIPGAIFGGLMSGIGEGLTAKKNVTEKAKELAEAQTALEEANKKGVEASVLQSTAARIPGSAEATSAYTATALTVYPYSQTLVEAIKQRTKPTSSGSPGPSGGETGEQPANR